MKIRHTALAYTPTPQGPHWLVTNMYCNFYHRLRRTSTKFLPTLCKLPAADGHGSRVALRVPGSGSVPVPAPGELC